MTSKFTGKPQRIAIIGATGIVGRELISILAERPHLVASLHLFSSKKSAGEKMDFGDDSLVVQELTDINQIQADIAFFAAGSSVSKDFIPALSARGVVCIDKSSAYRSVDGVPLVVGHVNAHVIGAHKIIASPNCVATPLAQVLAPIHKLAGLEQVVVSTYQAVSGAGQAGFLELESQVRDLFNHRDIATSVFGQRIAFNVLPFIPARSSVDDHLKTEEEYKIIAETKKILDISDLKMDITCVRVPVFNGHSMSVHIGTKNPLNLRDALDSLAQAPDIVIVDDLDKKKYPTALDACGKDKTLVGRIRPNTAVKNGLSLWISSDNLRTGAALNAVRIAETISLG